MINKFIVIFFILFLGTLSIYSESSGFSHPLIVEPVGIYNKVRLDGQASDNRESNIYEREIKGSFEGEYKLGNYFSIKGNAGVKKFDSSKSASISNSDRYSLAVKFASEHGNSDFRFSWGATLRGYSMFKGQYPKSESSGDLYLIRPSLSFGIGIQKLEIISELSVQSETNSSFKEGPRQEFKRNYLAGLSFSYPLGDKWIFFLETEYKEPYEKKIDLKIRSWNSYPGLSYKLYSSGILSVSVQVPIQSDSYNWDRGMKISYFHFFN
jgi:hypothetical protein